MGAVEFALSRIIGGNGGGGGGGSSVPEKDVNFIDYDGTIVKSYTVQEFANLSAMPDNPTHDGLTAQGWNWGLADAKTYVATYGKLWIGQMYITASGDTEIDIALYAPRLNPYLGIAVKGKVEVDWGDGTAKDTVTGTSLTTQIRTPHTYDADGEYTIKIHAVTGSFSFYGSSTYSVISGGFSNANNNRVYSNTVLAVRIGGNITNLGTKTFYQCNSLKSVTIPSTVTTMASESFNYCNALKSITIPINWTNFGINAFAGCSSIKSIAIPNKVTSGYGTSTFTGCSSIKSITIPDSITSVSPKGLTIISTSKFSSCSSLSFVIIPNTVKNIYASAFQNCYDLPSVTIPSLVVSIDASVFQNCYGLGAIHFKPTTPPTVSNSNAFANIPTDCLLYIPFSALAAYLSASNYPAPATYTYMGFATYNSGETLPATDSTEAYNVVWYASKADAIAQTNPITEGNGEEIYCRYTAA